MELIDRDKRDGYIYDVAIKGLDANFWANVTGTPTVATGKIRLNAATMASYILHEFPDIEFLLTIPAAPTSGDVRQFGLLISSSQAVGAAYFDITGTTFSAKVFDNAGNVTSKVITWDAGNWSNKAVLYRITQEADIIRFWTGVITAGVAAYTLQATIAAPVSGLPSNALPILIKNGNSDNMDLTYVNVKRAAGIV